MALRRSYAAQRTLAIETAFDCRTCGAWSPCRVLGRGTGHTRSAGWGHNDTAADLAGDYAHEDAQRDAAALLKLAPCPRCGKRDGAAVRAMVRRAVLMTVVCFALTAAAVAWAQGDHRGITVLAADALALALPCLAVAGVSSAIRLYVLATRRVQFTQP